LSAPLFTSALTTIQQPSDYHFSLTSGDGSKMHIDGTLVINNDGLHSVEERTGSATPKAGCIALGSAIFKDQVTGWL
jgi:hypothetical protein